MGSYLVELYQPRSRAEQLARARLRPNSESRLVTSQAQRREKEMIKALGRRGARMLLTAAALLVGATGIALATIPSSSGVINGCYEKRLGILRVIDADAGKTCTKYENPISWNQQGPKGEPGPAGPAGADGIGRASIQRRQTDLTLPKGPGFKNVIPLATPMRPGAKHIVTAELTLVSGAESPWFGTNLHCRLTHGGSEGFQPIATTEVTVGGYVQTRVEGSEFPGPPQSNTTAAALSGFVSAPASPSHVGLQCGQSTEDVVVRDATIVALEVGELAYNAIGAAGE
jgi:hypothetical protein